MAGFIDRIRDESLSSSEIVKVYDQWSENYEETIKGRTPERIEYLMSLVERLSKGDKNVKILDLAAGTGFFGQLMHEKGYKYIDAVDGSEKMLENAQKMNVYNRIVCSFIGTNRLDFPEDFYDLIFCVGSLYENHVTDDCFPELLRITKPGGYLVFAVIEKAASQKIEKTMQEFHDQKKWNWIEKNVVEKYNRHVLSDGSVDVRTGLIYVFQRPE